MQEQEARRLKTANTAKARASLSAPSAYLLSCGPLEGRILDFGCGRGDLAKFLDGDIEQWDPNWHPKRPRGKFDVVICNYVLNVLPPSEADLAIRDAKSFVRKGGYAYFSVRRDLPSEPYSQQIIKRREQYYFLPKGFHDLESIYHRSGKFEIYAWRNK